MQQVKLILVALLITSSLAVDAGLMKYKIDFSGDADGSGSFSWDPGARMISNLVLDLGSGMTGEINPEWSAKVPGVPGVTLSQLFFNIVTGIDVPPSSCPGNKTNCSYRFDRRNGLFGESISFVRFTIGPGHFGKYELFGSHSREINGIFTARAIASIPEPGILALLVIGMFGNRLVNHYHVRPSWNRRR